MATEEMSREEKEALLNIRMEQIRKKNAELQKRYEEVKADKQNAEEFSNTFKETRRNVVEEPRARRPPQKPSERPREKARYSEGRTPQTAQRSAPEEQEKKRPQRFTEDDGPPPDPSYSFLSDRSREGNSSSNQDRHRDSRRHPGNFGGKDFENVKSTMENRRGYDKSSPRQPPQSKLEMSMRMTGRERCEYERWRSERTKIEHDRLNRQKTTSGEWKREWDREKIPSNEPEDVPQNRWGPRNRGGDRGGRGGDRGSRGGDRDGRGGDRDGRGDDRGGRGGRRGRGGRGPRQWSDQQRQPYSKSPESDDAPPPKENHPRHIQLDNDNINVSFSNDRVAPVNRPWRTSDDRCSTSSREYSSSVSEDERPLPGQRSDMRWCDMVKSPKNKKPSIAENEVFEKDVLPQGDCKQVNPKPQSPKAEKVAVEQRVIFVDTGLHALPEVQPKTLPSQLDAPPSGDDVPDDASWDDEGSWEEANSGNGSQELSQHNQVVLESGLQAESDANSAEVTVAPQEGSFTQAVCDVGGMQTLQSDSRESTPVVDVHEPSNEESEQSKIYGMPSVDLDQIEDVHTETAVKDDQQSSESLQFIEALPQTVDFSYQPVELSDQHLEAQPELNVPQQSVKITQSESLFHHVKLSDKCTESRQDLDVPQQSVEVTKQESSLQHVELSDQPSETPQVTQQESSLHHVELSDQPSESRQNLDVPQQSVEVAKQESSLHHVDLSDQPSECRQDLDVPPQHVEITKQESSYQHEECQKIAEVSQQRITEDSQQTADILPRHVESPHTNPTNRAAEEARDESILPEKNISVAPLLEVNEEYKYKAPPTSELAEIHAAMADSTTKDESENQALVEAANIAEPVPSDAEANHASNSEQ